MSALDVKQDSLSQANLRHETITYAKGEIFYAMFFAICCLQKSRTLMLIQAKVIRYFIDNLLSSAKFFDDAPMFQQCAQ